MLEHSVESIKGIKHPAIYPVKIVAEFLHLLTRSGDVVLDPFIGSGSTAVACKQLGRHFIGYDINPEYCEYAQNRVETLINEDTLPLFEIGYRRSLSYIAKKGSLNHDLHCSYS